ncbi:MAG: hypothetical protein J6W73_02980, partial [Verrucomicrobia bacterium]|nr:hypothetical protein [Verrucomicrobiota bacterium]
VLCLIFICALNIHSEKLRKRFEPAPSKDRIFRCKKCDFVYTDDPDVDRSRCPHCGAGNESVKF